MVRAGFVIAAAVAAVTAQSQADKTCSEGSCEGRQDDSSLLQKQAQTRMSAANNSSPKPHIVFLLMDDVGWSDTEFGGSGTADEGFTKTPFMKSMQPESLLLSKMYAYAWCAPSRAALLSGRLPVHVNVNSTNPMAFIQSDPLSSGDGIPAGMTVIGAKMKTAGYATHYLGKWGAGFTWKGQWPTSPTRGFDTFFGYMHDSVDYWSQNLNREAILMPGSCEGLFRAVNKSGYAVDLMRNDGPAKGENGTYWIDYLFLKDSLNIIDKHDVATPLFLIHAFHSVHTPLNAPAELYVDEYAPPPCEGEDAMRNCYKESEPSSHDDRRSHSAMITWMDGAMKQIVDKLKDKGMWDNTLVVVSTDNGGPQYLSLLGYQLWGSGNNRPLRGGKTSEFNGGIRINAWATGGLIPTSMRGKESNALMHITDWYATFCHLAGVDPKDDAETAVDLPGVDSINQWPVISGETKRNQRTWIQSSPVTLIDHGGKWKIMTGGDPGSISFNTVPGYVTFDMYNVGYYTGYPQDSAIPGAILGTSDVACSSLQSTRDARGFNFPNMINCSAGYDCTAGCLFNLDEDPNEETNVAAEHPEILAEMLAKVANYSKLWTKEEPWGVFNPIRSGSDPRYHGPDNCSGVECTSMKTCDEFVYVTGFYSWAAEE